MRFLRAITASAAAAAVALGAIGCTGTGTEVTAPARSAAASAAAVAEISAPSVPPGSEAAPAQDVPDASTGTAWAALETLPVKGRAPRTGYDRDQFGPTWADVDRNGCDTRNDILARELVSETFKPGTRNCVVATGVLDDPYTATEIHFLRGQDTSEDVPVDHVVALGDAWQKGAQQLTLEVRTAFANDPLNLLAVDGSANAQKSDSDAASWLPPNRSFRCHYVARQIAVKAAYELWVTTAEKNAMAQVLTSCPDQALPGAGAASTAYQFATRATRSPAPAAPGPTTSFTPAPHSGSTDPRFGSCAKAKAAGYGHYVSGTDPEYDWYRDGDGDGINCE